MTWKPHEKSMSAGQLALPIARTPANFTSEPQPSSVREILNAFEEKISTVKNVLTQFDDARMQETWHIVAGDTEVLAIPRARFLRDIMLNH